MKIRNTVFGLVLVTMLAGATCLSINAQQNEEQEISESQVKTEVKAAQEAKKNDTEELPPKDEKELLSEEPAESDIAKGIEYPTDKSEDISAESEEYEVAAEYMCDDEEVGEENEKECDVMTEVFSEIPYEFSDNTEYEE